MLKRSITLLLTLQAALAEQLGLNDGAARRYVRWIGGLLHGDLGISYAYSAPVAAPIVERLMVTVPLALLAFALGTVLAPAAGIYAAAGQGRTGHDVVMLLSPLGLAVPNFWFSIGLIWLFAVGLRWLLAGGSSGWNTGALAALQSLMLPAVALAVVQAASLARVARTAVL